MAKKLNLNEPLIGKTRGTELCFVGRNSQGKLVFSDVNSDLVWVTDERGYQNGSQLVVNAPVETVEILSLYPDGNVYRKGGCCPTPVRNSIYGVDNLIQIKVTRRGGKIVRKEFC